ncbi:non-ribosomal peptide synthetase [Amycolatopsis aidingensis]|uniref:non-ribosomal peptide synthetase n=1 Tax=Amycolatopsis aidingensis TaxID=2842453 RepID=UPI001C0C7BB3|nr:non-ribosomal peptide synthetase [Amycolatopsis aidingensis]
MTEIIQIPLSVTQQALWVSWQLDRAAYQNMIVTPFAVRGTVDPARLDRAVAALGERFPLLRGVVRPAPEGPVLSWAGQPRLRLRERVFDEPMEQAVRTAARVPFDLEQGPPSRFELLHAGGETVLLISVAHLVYDGMSLLNLLPVLAEAYRGVPLPPPADLDDIREFNLRQHELAEGDAGAGHREFWREHLGTDLAELPELTLPAGPDPAGEFQMRTVELDRELVQRVRTVAKQLALTSTVVLYAAYLVLLRRHTGRDDLVVSMPTHGRRGRPGLREAVGFFSNAVPIRQRLDDSDTYASAAQRIGADIRRCLRFADLPQPAILRSTGAHGPAEAVVGTTIFQYWNSSARGDVDVFDHALDEDCSLSLLPPHDVAGYRLQTMVREDRDGFTMQWKDTAGELGLSALDLLAEDYLAVLDELVTDPDRGIGPAVPAGRAAARGFVLTGRAMLDRLHPVQPAGEHPPATPHQERMGFVDRFENGVVYPGAPVYHNLPLVRLLSSVPAADRLAEEFTAALADHPVLRTNLVFTERGFEQQVHAPRRGEVTWFAEPAEGAELPERLRRWLDLPFDLGKDLLVRVAVQTRVDGSAWLVLVGHQAVVDRASLRLLAARLIGETVPAPPVVEVDRDRVAHDLAAVAHRLSGEIEPLRLPESRRRDAVHVYREDAVDLTSPPPTELETLAAAAGVSTAAVLLSTFGALLSWYSGQDELVIGTTQPARNESNAGAVGPLSTLVPIRLRTGTATPFLDLLRQAEAELDFARRHDAVPFDDLVRVLDPGKDMSRTALFDVLFSYLDAEQDGGLSAGQALLGSGAGKYDLHLALRPRDGRQEGRLVFNAEYFDRSRFVEFDVHFGRLLAQATADPEVTLGALDPATEDERRRQLREWNDTASGYPEITLTELLLRQARRAPDATAVTDGDTRLSYRELISSAEELAHGLVAAGVRPGDLVGLHLGRGTGQVTAILAVLLAGAGYLPVDVDLPLERKQFVLADARVDVLVGGARGAADELELDSVHTLPLDELTGYPPQPLPEVNPDSAAYCIYTSGTTGRPKGVVISHRNVVRLLAPEDVGFDFGPADVWTLFHSYHFDFSVWELFGCLSTGGRLVVVHAEQARDAERFAELLVRERVTVLNQTPGAFAQLVGLPAVAGELDLRYVIFGGDRLDPARIADWAAAHPQVALVNMYGITEVTVHATAHRITAAELAGGTSLVGGPIPTTRIYVLDRRTGRRLLPTGAVGEVYVGGPGVADGYLRRPALTAERFVPNPFAAPGEADLLFRSGDLGRWWPDGSLEICGRADSQVKIRGYRVELGEIESCLTQHSAVGQAVVSLLGGSAGVLVAFVETAAQVTEGELRAHLVARLPGYLVPARYHLLSRIPLTSNGKPDRKALARLAERAAPQQAEADRDEPSGPTALAVAEAWAELLGVTGLTARSSFFELGGHSLLAAKLLATLSERVGVALPIRLLFEHPRLQDLADAIDALAATAETPADAGTRDGEPGTAEPVELPASSFQERIFLAQRVEPEAHRYVVPLLWRVSGTLDTDRLAGALAAVVRRHEILRTRFEVVDGTLRQRVGEPWQPALVEEAVPDLDGWLRDQLATPIDPASGRPLRCGLVSAGGQRVFAILVHHLAWDLGSAPVLLEELRAQYESEKDIPAPAQYRQFVAAQQAARQRTEFPAELDYWARTLHGAAAYLPLPAPAEAGPSGAVRVPLPAGLSRRLAELQTGAGVSWFMAAATALTGVLHRFTGADDVTIGVPVDNREATGRERLIGPCLNTVVLRSEQPAGGTVGDLLSTVRERVLGALEHRLTPFESVVEHLNPARRPGWTPYADVMLNVNTGSGTKGRLGTAELDPFTVDAQWEYDTKFGLTLTVTESDGEIGAMLSYRGDRIGAADARQLATLFGRLLAALPEVLDVPLATVDLMAPDELDRLLLLESGPAAAEPDSVPAMIGRRLLQGPDRPAISSSTGELSYAELDRRVTAMAHRLRAAARTGGAGTPVVAMLLDRGESLVVSQLAAWRAGFAFCPIDPGYPADRIRFMLDDLVAVAAVTDHPELAELAAGGEVPVVDPGERAAAGDAAAELPGLPEPDDHACVIYTSGTTGQPKGSVWRHRGIAQLARWHVDTLGVTEHDRASLLASVGFDGAQWELWPYLVAGACVLPYERPIVVPEVVDWLDHNRITMCFMPTPLAEVLVAGERQPRTLRWLTIGGTTFTTRLPADACYRVCNAYGPSENTVVGSVLLIGTDNTLPVNDVGRPIQGTSVSIVDSEGKRVPVGLPGEILLGGVAVADGYWRRPEATEERFLPGPWYRTGDLGRWNPDGRLEFLGRVDRQFKIRGYRIEPHEIEVALQRDPLVRQALVAGFPDSVPALVGYLVPAAGAERDTGSVITRLAEWLPPFMVPDAIVWLDEIPTSVHGKLETSALPKAGRADLVRQRGDLRGPETETEHTIAGVWAEVLRLDEIGVEDNFFDLGGNSLLLSTLHSRLEARLANPVPIHRLFEFPTIRGLARWVDSVDEPANGTGTGAGEPDPILARARRSRAARGR